MHFYDVYVSYDNDKNIDIEFDRRKVRKLPSVINPNIAHGPGGIHGKILKNCAVGLVFPLSFLTFRIIVGTFPKSGSLLLLSQSFIRVARFMLRIIDQFHLHA